MITELKKYTCICCGGELEERNGKLVCAYCKSRYEKIEHISEEEVVALNRATTDRNLLRFDESLEEYNLLLKKYPDNEMANWGAFLCDYGIIYEQDYNGEYIPTCHRLNERPVSESPNYARLSLEHQASANEIEKLRHSIMEKAKKIQPYDVFICYKATEDDRGVPTREASWARDTYELLKREFGLRVFFAEKSLEKSNVDYEPHIYAALRSAKLMLVMTTSIEHLNATWVANEWKRYTKYIQEGENKTVRVVYDSIQPYNLPKVLQNKQAINHDSNRWESSVIESVEELFGKKKQPTVKEPKIEKPKQPPKPVNKKALAIVISIIAAILLGGGIYYKISVDAIHKTTELISSLPEKITDFSYYEDMIEETYASYNKLAEWQRKKVDDSKLTAIMPEYNEYKNNTYKIVYNENTPTNASSSVVGVPSNQSWTYGTELKDDTEIAVLGEAPTLNGWTFEGWYGDEACTVKVGNAGETLVRPECEGGTVNYYAKWTAKTFTVAYNANGGSGTMPTVTYAYDSGQVLQKNVFSRSNYVFLGWSENASAIEATYLNETSINNMTLEDTTLYAVWLRVDSYVEFTQDNGHRNKTVTDEDKVYDTVYTGFNVAALLENGYTKLTVSLYFSVDELDEGYKDMWIYSYIGGKKLYSKTDMEFSSSGWQHRTLDFTLNIADLKADGSFVIEWGASGNFGDDWELGITTLTMSAKK